jgi:hypothetical protein
MDVVETHHKVFQVNLGGVRLKLHPGWMGGEGDDSRFGHYEPVLDEFSL